MLDIFFLQPSFLVFLGPRFISSIFVINSFLFLRALILRFFFTVLLSSAYSIFSVVLLLSLFLSIFLRVSSSSISLSSAFCSFLSLWRSSHTSLAASRIVLFNVSIDDGSSFSASNRLCNDSWNIVVAFSRPLISILNACCRLILFSLSSLLFIFTFPLTILWSLPMSTWVMTSVL